MLPVIWVLVSIATAQFTAPAFAQNNVAQADTERTLLKTPQNLLEIEKRRREAEQKRGALPTRKVTFADILANPDDIELNLAYAQNQIADGNVQGASATYERILLIQPENARVRLLYAIVLFRLDSLKEAERELLTISKLKMPAGLRSQIDHYLKQIKLRSKATRYSFMVSAGGQYDWNKNSAPSSNQLLVADLLGTLDGDDRRTHDYNYNLSTRLEFSHDLEYQDRHRLKGAVSH
jgi:tetratricopeptide (TPR) repeat protein